MTIGSTRPSENVPGAAAGARNACCRSQPFRRRRHRQSQDLPVGFLSCAFEARNHAWSRQAIGIARGTENGATIIGTSKLSTPGDAAFANATLGHGLVREDMHAASICHHGVVIWPTLLALSERAPLPARDSLALRSSAMRPERRSAAHSLPPIWRGFFGRPALSRRWVLRSREAMPSVSPKMPRQAPFPLPPTHRRA